jgi:hypothetical protein
VINSMSTPGFAGPPTYEVLIFFIFVLVNGHLNLAYFRRSRVRPAFACRSWAFAPTRPRVEA